MSDKLFCGRSLERSGKTDCESILFNGRVLNRGFWIYIIDIDAGVNRYVYVGRTGDSSSCNAGSPFARIGKHLDVHPNARGNALARNLEAVGVRPSECRIEMICLGPLYPEALAMELHRDIRDRVAALESGLAQALRETGFTVIGKHLCRSEPDSSLLESIVSAAQAKLGDPRRRTRR
jgi:hypothetical protein